MLINNKPIKVLIVDDSAFMRKILSDILNSNPDLTVVATAKNGKEAIQIINQIKPDVITMDVEMPIMNGIDALQQIMRTNPIPIVMLSSLTGEGAESTLTALELGAVDFLQKPTSVFEINAEGLKAEIIDKIKAAARAKIIKKPLLDIKNSKIPLLHKSLGKTSTKPNFIAIGTSTGGPRALQSVIPMIPSDINASIFIVQHMPPGFTKSMAERLDSMSQITVKEAEDNERVVTGTAYIAPGDYHMEVVEDYNNKFIIKLTKDKPVAGHRPSADVMYSSIAQLKNINTIGVIMTGMGSDGTNGLKELKANTKAIVIAQDEESCVVYGMPKSAVIAGLVDALVPLNEITNTIINRLEVL